MPVVYVARGVGPEIIMLTRSPQSNPKVDVLVGFKP